MINIIVLSVCIAIIIIYAVRRNNNFLAVHEIIGLHFSIFKKNKLQITFFYIIPLVMAICIADLGVLNQQATDSIIIVVGIFIAIFFSILGFVLGFPKKVSENVNSEIYLLVHRETFCTILFEILLCVITLILAFTYAFVPNEGFSILRERIYCIILFIWRFSIYYLLLVCLLNMLIVVKRLKKLYDVQ